MFRLFVSTALTIGGVALADAPSTQPAGAAKLLYSIQHEQRSDPPMRIWVLQVDLTDPRVSVKVLPSGADPDGDGPWQTTLKPATEVAEQNGLELAVNASFFSVDKTGEWKGKGYTTGQPAAAIGWTATDGKQWSSQNESWPVLWIDASGAAHIGSTADAKNGAQQMVAGNATIMTDGEAVQTEQKVMLVRHPRTAVGVDREGKTLTILTVDGRQPGVSLGMTGQELFETLKKFGVDDAINLDGGGSTTLVERDSKSGELRVINRPSDGKLRPVANVLGIDIKP
jgi:exopolysaccharide biosynthesis protein